MPTRFTWKWKAAQVLARVLCGAALRVRIRGIERIPREGPTIVAANHMSFLDPVIVWSLVGRRRRPAKFLAAAEFFRSFWVGWGLRLMEQIPIKRGENDRAAILAAEDSLRSGDLLGVFPEGKINDHPEALLPGKRGMARLALETGAPIVPVALWGPQRRLPKGGLRWTRPLRMPVGVVIGEAIDPHGVHDATEDALRALTDTVMERLERLRQQAVALTDGGATNPAPAEQG